MKELRQMEGKVDVDRLWVINIYDATLHIYKKEITRTHCIKHTGNYTESLNQLHGKEVEKTSGYMHIYDWTDWLIQLKLTQLL